MSMKEKDRRFYKTKQQLFTAMMTLLKTKSFEQITVKDICERAGVSRSGFYLHYTDKYDMVKQHQLEFVNHVNQLIATATEEEHSMDVIMLKLLRFFNEEGRLLALLISDKGSMEIQQQIKRVLQQNALENILPYADMVLETPIEKHYLVIYYSNALFGLLQDWVNNGQRESPEELARIVNKFLPYKFIR